MFEGMARSLPWSGAPERFLTRALTLALPSNNRLEGLPRMSTFVKIFVLKATILL
jgi:hypothetical protein